MLKRCSIGVDSRRRTLCANHRATDRSCDLGDELLECQVDGDVDCGLAVGVLRVDHYRTYLPGEAAAIEEIQH
jgi:hypothetical protein